VSAFGKENEIPQTSKGKKSGESLRKSELILQNTNQQLTSLWNEKGRLQKQIQKGNAKVDSILDTCRDIRLKGQLLELLTLKIQEDQQKRITQLEEYLSDNQTTPIVFNLENYSTLESEREMQDPQTLRRENDLLRAKL